MDGAEADGGEGAPGQRREGPRPEERVRPWPPLLPPLACRPRGAHLLGSRLAELNTLNEAAVGCGELSPATQALGRVDNRHSVPRLGLHCLGQSPVTRSSGPEGSRRS